VCLPPFEETHAKLTPYEGGVNVPLVIFGPAVTESGWECSALVNSTDMFATSLELAGYSLDQVLPTGHLHDSVSVVRYLADRTQPPLRRWAFAEMWKPNGFGPKNLDQRILRGERYKIIRSGVDSASHVFEMYDLEMDPFETVDLMLQIGGLTAGQQAHFDALKATLDQLLL